MSETPSTLRSLAERLCQVRTGTEPEIRAALDAATTPAPFGARECVITAGALSVAAVDLKSPALTRADLEQTFGLPREMPRTGPHAAYVLAYDVAVPGAPARVTAFARFAERPQDGTAARSLLLRIDPA